MKPFLEALDFERVTVADLDKYRKCYCECQLYDKVGVAERGIEVQALSVGREEVLHIIIEEKCAEYREGETDVRGDISENTALKENSHWQNGVVEIVAPTQKGLQRVG